MRHYLCIASSYLHEFIELLSPQSEVWWFTQILSSHSVEADCVSGWNRFDKLSGNFLICFHSLNYFIMIWGSQFDSGMLLLSHEKGKVFFLSELKSEGENIFFSTLDAFLANFKCLWILLTNFSRFIVFCLLWCDEVWSWRVVTVTQNRAMLLKFREARNLIESWGSCIPNSGIQVKINRSDATLTLSLVFKLNSVWRFGAIWKVAVEEKNNHFDGGCFHLNSYAWDFFHRQRNGFVSEWMKIDIDGVASSLSGFIFQASFNISSFFSSHGNH